MAGTSLRAASVAVAVGDGATDAGIGIAKGATTAALGVAQGATALGLGIARVCIAAPAAIAGVTGPNRVSEALWRADGAVSGAHACASTALRSANARANEAMTNARDAAGSAMNGARSSLEQTARQDGLHLRVVLGNDTAEVVLAAQRLASEFGGPLAAAPKMQLFHAAKAWAALQRASRAPPEEGDSRAPQSAEAKLPLDSERWMRFTAAAFGAYRAGCLLDDQGAEVRTWQRLRQEALAKSAGERERVLASFSASVAELGEKGAGLPPQHDLRREAAAVARQERREAAAAAKRERQAAKAVQREAQKAAKAQRRAAKNSGPAAVERQGEIAAAECMQEEAAEVGPEEFVAECLAEVLNGEERLFEPFFGDEAEPEALELEAPSSGTGSSRARKEAAMKERKALRAARAEQREAFGAMRAQEQQALAVAKVLRRRALLEARAQGREVLQAALAEWKTPVGRGKQALACAGLDPEGIEVVLFEEANQPEAGEPHVPGQLLAVDHERGCVVLALRGSSCLRDALVDLDCEPAQVTLGGCQGLAHGGMLRAAQKLAEPLAVAVEDALSIVDGPRRVLVVGHSLGAGVGALLTALWHEGGGRIPAAEVRCLAFACPQVLDLSLAATQARHTTSIVVGEDCVPCLSLATCLDLRDALVLLADPEARGLGPSYSASEILATAEAGDLATMRDTYLAVRKIVGSASGRLFPAGRLIKHIMGEAPRYTDHTAVDEMVVTMDMVAGHMPRRYLASTIEITAAGGCSESLWSEASSSLVSGIALALQGLPSLM